MAFHIQEHVISCQHFRQCDSSNASGQHTPRLAVKQYTPINNPSPNPGDITIIGGHANAFVKELYEPLWEDLEQHLSKRGRKIRSIWIADVQNQGMSGILNTKTKYDDVSWFDHSRDLLHMINHFRSEIVQPVVAVGHSMGGNQHVMLSLAHPMLFSTMILIDPIIAPAEMIKVGWMLAKGTLRRRVQWPSREAADKYFSRSFRTWDSRVREKFTAYALYPFRQPDTEDSEKAQSVSLVTGRFQELVGFVRPDFIYSGKVGIESVSWVEESLMAHKAIDLIPCDTLYICGEKSVSAGPEIRKDWLARTGTGAHMGKKGRERRVEAAVLPGVGHFVPMEAPRACAEAAAKWIDEETGKWEKEEEGIKSTWRSLTEEEKEERANVWMEGLKAKL